jgi:hypothetical protein
VGNRKTLSSISAYLGDTPDVLLPVFGREAKVLVQAEPDVVAVESVGLKTKVEEVLLKGNGNGGLSRRGETGEPDSGTLLLAKIGALLAGETGVPGDVAIAIVRICVGLAEGRWRGCRVEWRGTTRIALVADGGDSRCHFCCCEGGLED